MAEDWTNLPKEHNLAKFQDALPAILESAGYSEMYGVELRVPQEGQPAPHTTLIILQKYLRANVDDLAKAKEQLTASLAWRKQYQPLRAKEETFDADKFGKLGYVTKVKGAAETKNEEDVTTFNIYGAAAKDVKKTFGDTDAFIRWRVALMELTLDQLKLNEADQRIPDYGQGPDPYKSIAVHDYLAVSFLRQPGEIKAASSKIVQLFQDYYPETVSYKYFVNVPIIMQWMMGAMKALMSKDSIQTMTWMTYGSELYKYLGNDIPKEYGGSGAPLGETAITPKYGNKTEAEASQNTPAIVSAAAEENGGSSAEEKKDTAPATVGAAEPQVAELQAEEPVKTEPVKTEPVKTEPVKTEPVKTEPAVPHTVAETAGAPSPTPEVTGLTSEKATVA